MDGYVVGPLTKTALIVALATGEHAFAARPVWTTDPTTNDRTQLQQRRRDAGVTLKSLLA